MTSADFWYGLFPVLSVMIGGPIAAAWLSIRWRDRAPRFDPLLADREGAPCIVGRVELEEDLDTEFFRESFARSLAGGRMIDHAEVIVQEWEEE
jgi:hypothetical protein